MENMVKAHVIIKGRVQGVFFRVKTKQTADGLNVSGWVRNKSDGTVEAVFEGKKNDVIPVINWCHQGPSRSVVTDVNVTWHDYKKEYKKFSITG